MDGAAPLRWQPANLGIPGLAVEALNPLALAVAPVPDQRMQILIPNPAIGAFRVPTRMPFRRYLLLAAASALHLRPRTRQIPLPHHTLAPAGMPPAVRAVIRRPRPQLPHLLGGLNLPSLASPQLQNRHNQNSTKTVPANITQSLRSMGESPAHQLNSSRSGKHIPHPSACPCCSFVPPRNPAPIGIPNCSASTIALGIIGETRIPLVLPGFGDDDDGRRNDAGG